MPELIKIALDAMGGDYAPKEPVKAAVKAVSEVEDAHIILVGPEEVIKAELSAYTYPEDRISIRNANEVISPEESPVKAIRSKKDSSIVVGSNMLRNGEASTFISAGSTGALVAAGALIVGRIKGVERPMIAFELPAKDGNILVLDCGSAVDPRPSMIVQFARMGNLYCKSMMGIEAPRVALVNIGAESEKGNALTKASHELMCECHDFNYTGFIEARDIPLHQADVIVTDAFTGNVILKLYEGMGLLMLNDLKKILVSNTKAKIGAAILKSTLKKSMKRYDMKTYGGAPLLGVKGLVLKTHGNSDAQSFYNTILQGIDFARRDVNGQIQECFRSLQ